MRAVTSAVDAPSARRRPWGGRWPLERVLFAMAGTVAIGSAILAAVVSPWFLVLTAFVGVSQWSYVLVGDCPASLVLRRLTGLSAECGR